MVEAFKHLRFLTPQRPNLTAPLLVFLPGMDGTGTLLRIQTEGLESLFDIRCLSIPADDLTHWDDLARQTLALIEAELVRSPRRPVYLCGESFGGCLALKTLLLARQTGSISVDRVVLVNPASAFHRIGWMSLGSSLTQLLPEILHPPSCVALLPFLASFARIDATGRRDLLLAMQSVSQQSAYWRLQLLREFQISPGELAQITSPVLLVASRGDRLLPSVEEAHQLAEHLPDVRIHILPHSGHACLLESEVSLYQIFEAEDFLLDSVPVVRSAA